GGDAAPAQKAYLVLGGTWVSFSAGEGGTWKMNEIADSMGPTWNGGTDMLLAATHYILDDPDADVPAKCGITWSNGPSQSAQIDGKLNFATAVDLASNGELTLFVADDAGDRFFKYDAKDSAMKDVTPAAKLASKSKVAAWVDANADGRMDLLSWDGKAL